MGYNKLSPEKKAEVVREDEIERPFVGWAKMGLSSRERGIIDGAAKGVTKEEVKRVLYKMQYSAFPCEEIGKVRILYDRLIDDGEKRLRKDLGIEFDYSHVVGRAPESVWSTLYVDGLPPRYWSLLNDPNYVPLPKTKAIIAQAIKWLELRNRHEDIAFIKEKYKAEIAKPPQARPGKNSMLMTNFEIKLLNTPDFIPNNPANVRRAISRLERIGHIEAACKIANKYDELLNKERPTLDLSYEEAQDYFESLLGRKIYEE